MSENSATSTETPVVVNGGDNALLFDELVNISEESEVSKQDKKAAKAEKESKDGQNPKPKEKDVTTTTSKDEAKKDEPKAKESKDSGKKEAKGDLEKSEAEKEAAKRKAYKAKFADQEHELDEDLEFEHKVNGEPTKVKLKELLSDFSGRKSWDKAFQDISKERKEVVGYRSQLEQVEGKIKSMFEEKDPTVRIFKMAEMVGVNPLDFRKNFLAQNMKLVEQYANMTEAERNADDLKFENEYIKHQMSTKSAAEQKRQALEQHQAKVSKLLASSQITEEEYDAQEAFLKDLYGKQKRDVNEVTPELVIEVNQKNKLWSASQPVFEKLGHQMEQQDMIDFIDKAHAHGLKPEQMGSVVDEIFGKGKAKAVIEEKKKQTEEFKGGVKPAQQKQSSASSEAWSFDQI